MTTASKEKIPRWYHGGIASAMAACCTHPLDLLKVRQYTVNCKEYRHNTFYIFLRYTYRPNNM